MNSKQKIYLFSGIFLIIVIILFSGIVKPLCLEIKQTAKLVEERNNKLLILQKTDEAYLRNLELEYIEIKDRISLIESGFLNNDSVVDFFISLEGIASNTFNRLEIEAGKFPEFTFHLLGNFSNSMKFLGWLENSKYFLNIEYLSMEGLRNQRSFLGEELFEQDDIKTVLKIKNYTKDQEIDEEQNLKSNWKIIKK